MNRSGIGRCAANGAVLAVMLATAVLGAGASAAAQSASAGDDTRAGRIVAQQEAKAKELKPYEPNKAEVWVKKLEEQFLTGNLNWYPFFNSAYAGGGFTLGAGYTRHVGDYNTVGIRGSFTPSGYKRLEGVFFAPRLLKRQAQLTVIGGWREATQVGFYGLGTGPTSKDDRANYSFDQPYVSANLDFRPRNSWLVTGVGAGYSQWNQGPGAGNAPSIEEVYTPETLAGLGSSPTYLHVEGTAAIDWRTSPGYSRRGGHYGVALQGFNDQDDRYSFRQVNYEAIQHIPIGRDAWVLSLRGRVETTFVDEGQEIPFFMLPALGGGSTLRGFTSWRFRDRHSLLLQAEWRVLVNSFFETALFYDAGKVTSRRSDLDLDGLKKDYGIGFRLHGPAATPLRIELARSNEGMVLVFSAHAAF